MTSQKFLAAGGCLSTAAPLVCFVVFEKSEIYTKNSKNFHFKFKKSIHSSQLMMDGKSITKILGGRGFSLNRGALEGLLSVLNKESDPKDALLRIISTLKTKGIFTVDEKSVALAVLELSKNDDDIVAEALKIWDAFSVPNTKFTRTRFETRGNSMGLHVQARTKTGLYRERLTYVYQRVMRNPTFAMGVADANARRSANRNKRVALTPIDALVSGGGDVDEIHHVLGILTRGADEDDLWIEDLNGRLPLDMGKCQPTTAGLFVEGCVVIIIGRLIYPEMEVDEDDDAMVEQDGGEHQTSRKKMSGKKTVFQVEMLGMPPGESKEMSERANPGCGYQLSGRPPVSATDQEAMRTLEMESIETMFVVISDVHLDDPDTMESMKTLFRGFADSPPQLFVLMGDFSKRPFGYGNSSTNENQITATEFGDLFERLADLMRETPSLLESATRWVFVPGPNDPSAGPREILPRPSLPKFISERFMDCLPASCRVNFTTNPSRVYFYNQEIVFFRNDAIAKMRRNCVVPPPNDAEISELFVKTVVDQAHLCPMLMDISPMYCEHERALRLYPLPDVIVMADHYGQYQWKLSECGVFNPGSFSADGSFVVYRPATMTTEYSSVRRGKSRMEE